MQGQCSGRDGKRQVTTVMTQKATTAGRRVRDLNCVFEGAVRLYALDEPPGDGVEGLVIGRRLRVLQR